MWTVGHSTRSADEFIELLRAHGIQAVADIRRFPGSRRHPHFARERLELILRENGIEYLWMPGLGGRRKARPDSHNTAWRVAAFRGYADYMETAEFQSALSRLVDVARSLRTAMMCAESLWWQCHRRLVSDTLLASGHTVTHIESVTKSSAHTFIPPAHLRDGKLSYAAEQQGFNLE